MVDPLVSIIMPAYNAGKFIRDAIESVQAQTYRQWELIVVNDGSSDDTRDIVQKIISNDNRIQLIDQVNKKQGAARNAAIRQSKGEFLAFLDADDLWNSEKLSLQVEQISSINADMIYSDAFLLKENNLADVMNSRKGWVNNEESITKILHQNFIPVLTVIVKRQAVDEVNGFCEIASVQNAEDYHLWLKLLFAGYSCFGMDAALAKYRVHQDNATSSVENVFWPICYALSDLKKTETKYSKLIANMLTNKLEQWLSTSTAADKVSFEKFCDLYFSAKNKKVPALLRFITNYLHYRNIPSKAFRLIYA